MILPDADFHTAQTGFIIFYGQLNTGAFAQMGYGLFEEESRGTALHAAAVKQIKKTGAVYCYTDYLNFDLQ